MKYDPVMVFWRDACFEEGWLDPEDIDYEVDTYQHVLSIGFFLREDDVNIHLCMSKTADGIISDLLTIPKEMVISKTFMLEKKK